MISRWNRMAILGLCAVCMAPGLLCAQEEKEQLRGLEARIMYEATTGLMNQGEYDRALRRFDWITANYKESVYAVLARQRRKEIRRREGVEVTISPPARVGLVAFGTLYATWVGMGTGILAESAELVYMGMIAGPMLGLSTTLVQTREAPISNGQASLLALGGAWGTWQGTGAAILAGSGYKGVTAASMAGGALGLLAASNVVVRRYVSAGEATLINFGGIWGTWFALCAGKILGVTDSDALLTSAMAGGNLGLVKMGTLAPRVGMSGGRARLINLGGIIGTLYGLGTAVLADRHHQAQPTFAMMLAGGILGLGAGTYLTRHYEVAQEYSAWRDAGHSPSAGREGMARGLSMPVVPLFPEAIRREEKGTPVREVKVELMRIRF